MMVYQAKVGWYHHEGGDYGANTWGGIGPGRSVFCACNEGVWEAKDTMWREKLENLHLTSARIAPNRPGVEIKNICLGGLMNGTLAGLSVTPWLILPQFHKSCR
jgi:hypothetical protein